MCKRSNCYYGTLAHAFKTLFIAGDFMQTSFMIEAKHKKLQIRFSQDVQLIVKLYVTSNVK